VRRVTILLSLLALAAFFGQAKPALATGFTQQETTIRMSDGVEIAASYFVPDGPVPTGGMPAVMLFHGLGESRTAQNAVGISLNDTAAQYLVPHGYAVLTFDIRGHGASGGTFALDGPREGQDTRELFSWLATRPGINATKIGAFGYSLGGGLVWRAAVEGVPFAAIETAVTWTDLYSALVPQSLTKSGAAALFFQSVASRVDMSISPLVDDLIASRNLAQIKALLDERSTRPRLAQLRTPTFMFQGRRDFAFGMDQAIAVYRRLPGPKRLSIVDFGHSPSSKPAAEIPHALTEGRAWFDRYLKGIPNGIDTAPPVELSPEPWTGKTYFYRSLPPVRTLSLRLGGAKTITAEGSLVVSTPARKRALETFGTPLVRVQATLAGGWPRLVAVLTARTSDGREIVVSEGGVNTASLTGKHSFSIRLISDSTPIPRGSRFAVTLAASSAAQSPGNLLYLNLPMPAGAHVALRGVSLTVPLLRTPVSR